MKPPNGRQLARRSVQAGSKNAGEPGMIDPMRQLQLFTTTQLAGMRNRSVARNHSPAAEAFRRTHQRHRAWGLSQRHAERLRRKKTSSADHLGRPEVSSQPAQPELNAPPTHAASRSPIRAGSPATGSTECAPGGCTPCISQGPRATPLKPEHSGKCPTRHRGPTAAATRRSASRNGRGPGPENALLSSDKKLIPECSKYEDPPTPDSRAPPSFSSLSPC